MYPIWIRDGKNTKPQTPIYYELAANGLFIRKETKFWDAVVPVDRISVLEKETPSIKIFLPKIPSEINKQAIRFLAWVYKKYKTEAVVLLWISKDNKEYRVTVPAQTVSSGHAEYEIPDRLPGYLLIGTFHSHGSMRAFHSGMDMADEEYFDGLHATFGTFDFEKSYFEISMQAVINGTRFSLEPAEWLEQIVSRVEEKKDDIVDKLFNWWDSDYRVPRAKMTYAMGNNDLIIPEGYNPPEEWQKNIKPKKIFNFLQKNAQTNDEDMPAGKNVQGSQDVSGDKDTLNNKDASNNSGVSS